MRDDLGPWSILLQLCAISTHYSANCKGAAPFLSVIHAHM
ncbi:hypothetical protein BVG79_02369 [Ketogulonicigenium robustum]|uniref:Uncharacterized protein n=1 Tax=Ketogulonicigenium robustum TaxID=92947 RepID=A0A1W6P2Q3_9RHOB|nr:hypothetical protein BVG79_02369 [Ketogulonicigenium robustum]